MLHKPQTQHPSNPPCATSPPIHQCVYECCVCAVIDIFFTSAVLLSHSPALEIGVGTRDALRLSHIGRFYTFAVLLNIPLCCSDSHTVCRPIYYSQGLIYYPLRGRAQVQHSVPLSIACGRVLFAVKVHYSTTKLQCLLLSGENRGSGGVGCSGRGKWTV